MNVRTVSLSDITVDIDRNLEDTRTTVTLTHEPTGTTVTETKDSLYDDGMMPAHIELERKALWALLDRLTGPQ